MKVVAAFSYDFTLYIMIKKGLKTYFLFSHKLMLLSSHKT